MDGQTDNGHQRLMPPPYRGGGIIVKRHDTFLKKCTIYTVVKKKTRQLWRTI